MNAAYTYVGERWRCRLDVINVVRINDSQSIPCVNIRLGIPLILQPIIDQDEPTGDRFDNQFVGSQQPSLGPMI